MKRIAKITEEQKISTDDCVDDAELDYLLQEEDSLTSKRQYFSWDSSVPSPSHSQGSQKGVPSLNYTPSPDPQPSEPASSSATDGFLLPDLDLDGLFDDEDVLGLSEDSQPSLEDLDTLGLFDDQENSSFSDSDGLSSTGFDGEKETDLEEPEGPLEDDLFSFVAEHNDENTLEEEDEPDWFDLAGEAEEFDGGVSSVFDDVEVEGAVDREERSLQAAMDVGSAFHLDASEIQTIAMVFEENGWGACRMAVVRELEKGTSVAELELAAEMKNVWLEHFEFYSSQKSNYRTLSWPTALKLANSFSGYPSLEEVEQLLIELHDHWREDKIQRFISRSFNEYLIGYLERVVDGFEYAPEWAIEQESPLVDDFFYPPNSTDIPAINSYELERVLRNVRLNSTWMN